MMPRVLVRARRWWLRRDLRVWYDPAYRLPLAGVANVAGMEPRRADYVAWYLLDSNLLPESQLRKPRPVSYEDMARVHAAEWLEALSRPSTLASVFPATPEEIPVDEVMHTVRLACGATIAGARSALKRGALSLKRGALSLNLLGGFHHGGVARGTGFCPVNDIAIAVAHLRSVGFEGRVVVLDLDAHPPDGTADCLKGDRKAWIGSLSGADWGPLPGEVDETVLPPGTGDAGYLAALEALLGRMPRAQLAFVIAGGDVLRGDRLAPLAMSLDGVRRRDLRVMEALEGVPSVWLPGGGYGVDAWRVLAGTGVALAAKSRRAVAESYDPLGQRFRQIARLLGTSDLTDEGDLSDDDLAVSLGMRRARRSLLLDFYSAEGVEYALHRYGVLGEVRRLGYEGVRIALDECSVGDRVRAYGSHRGAEHLLIELVVERRRAAGEDVLFVHWLSLRHPMAPFDARRRQLPGQDAPGLGLARDIGEVLAAAARRLKLAGVSYRPAYYHTAHAGRYRFRFIDPARQGRFEALARDLAFLPLHEATVAVAEKRVRMNGEPYAWEADEMVYWLDGRADDREAVRAERDRVRFTVEPAPAAAPAPPPPGPAAPPAPPAPGAA